MDPVARIRSSKIIRTTLSWAAVAAAPLRGVLRFVCGSSPQRSRPPPLSRPWMLHHRPLLHHPPLHHATCLCTAHHCAASRCAARRCPWSSCTTLTGGRDARGQ